MGDDIKKVLNYEAKYDYAERLQELRQAEAKAASRAHSEGASKP